MITRLLAAAAVMSLIAGCESSSDNHPADAQHAHYQPIDGRNLGPGLQEASHGDPQFPADVAHGGGGGMR